MNVAIILAGGSGTRVGANVPKQFVEVLGKPVLGYTIEIFENNPEIDAIEIGCHYDWIEFTKDLVKRNGYTKVKWIINGGDTFQQTVINCVNNLRNILHDGDYAMIQYGASPFTKQKIVSDALRVAKEKGMSFAATPCFQLMGSRDGEGISNNWIDRDKFVQVACPQTYKFGFLKQIYDEAEKRGLLSKIEPHTTSLMYALGYPLYESYSDQTNIKITTKEDLEIFEGWILYQKRKADK